MCYSLTASLAALVVGMASAAIVAIEKEARPVAYTIAWVSLVQAAEAVAHAAPSARGGVARALLLLLGTQLLVLAPTTQSCAVQAFAVALALAFALTALFVEGIPAVEVDCAVRVGCRVEWPFLRLQRWIVPALVLQYVVIAAVLFVRRDESPAFPAMLVAGALSLGLGLGLRNSPASPWCMFAAFSFPIVAGTVLVHRHMASE